MYVYVCVCLQVGHRPHVGGNGGGVLRLLDPEPDLFPPPQPHRPPHLHVDQVLHRVPPVFDRLPQSVHIRRQAWAGQKSREVQWFRPGLMHRNIILTNITLIDISPSQEMRSSISLEYLTRPLKRATAACWCIHYIDITLTLQIYYIVLSCTLRGLLIFLYGRSRTYCVSSLRAGPVGRIPYN